jgi:hypothetical protein
MCSYSKNDFLELLVGLVEVILSSILYTFKQGSWADYIQG